MPCDTQQNLTPTQRELMAEALKRLELGLGSNGVRLVIGAQGSIAFQGWNDRAGLSDLCAYRKLMASNSPELRRAVMRAEAMAGRKLDQRALAAGVHSHDGGRTWGTH